MKFYQYLIERLLVSEFRFGFELEALYEKSKYKNVLSYMKLYYPDLKIDKDSSLTGDSKHGTFEMKSPILTPNIKEFDKLEKFLLNLHNNYISTNETCGFHIHISFPNYNLDDVLWILCNIAITPKYSNTIKFFETYDFISVYSNDRLLEELKTAIKNKYIKKIKSTFDHLKGQKYNILNPSEHDTIEWRGPRNFLETKNINVIKDFIKRIHEVLMIFSKSLDNNVINGWLTKEKLKIGSYINFKDEPKIFTEFEDSIRIRLNKNFKWVYKINFKKIYKIHIRNGYLYIMHSALEGGEIKNGRFYYNNIISSQIIEGKFLENNFKKCKIYSGIFNLDTFNNCVLLNGEFDYPNIIKSTIEDGKFINGDISMCKIINGEFVKCDINTPLKSITNGTFLNCYITRRFYEKLVIKNGKIIDEDKF